MERVTLHTDLPELTNDLSDVIRLFLGECEITQEPGGSLTVAHTMGQEHVVTVGDARAVAALTPVGADELENKRLRKRAVKNAVYQAMKQATGRKPPWGSLTGIRPTRLFYEQLGAGCDEETACRNLEATFDVDREKVELLRDIARIQSGMEMPGRDDMDVYVGIPFCRTRCSYC